MAAQPTRRAFSVAEYYQMGEAGILNEDDRVELIEGEIVEMPPIGSPHASCVRRMSQRLFEFVGTRALVSVQDPLRLSDRSEPVPDLMLLRPRADFYASAHPTAADVFLLIEVSDTTLAYDRGTKVPLYAREGVPEVWIADLKGKRVLVFREPSTAGYRDSHTMRASERLAPTAFPDVEFAISDILG